MKGSFVVRHKINRNFTTIPNAICRDSRLSWKALGLLVYLLHVPEDFQHKLYNLARERRGNNGRDSTRSGLAELEAAGYVEIVRERDSRGRLGKTIWYVTDRPETGFPNVDKPHSD
jgi:hypothetical protein